MSNYQLQDLIVERIKPSDYKDMLRIYQKSIQENSEGFVQDINFHGNIFDLANDYVSQGGDMLVAKLDSKLVGFGGLSPMSQHKVELCKLHVDADYQGVGIGRKLTESLISRAKVMGFTDIELHVTATQVAAIQLYESLGFQKTKQQVYEIQFKSRKVLFDTLFMLLPTDQSSATYNKVN